MKGPALFIAHSLKRIRTLVIALAALLGAFQILLIVMAREFHRSKGLAGLADLLPPFVREFFGPSLSAFLSFDGMISQVYFHPIVLASLVALAIAIGTMPTAEIESGFVDLILSRPIARHWMITRSIIVAAICITAVLTTMMVATWAGLQAFGPRDIAWPPAARILSLAFNLGLLMFAWSAVAMAIGSAARRRSAAGTFAGLLALATFLLDFAARIWSPAKSIAWISPFHYYNPLELITGLPLEPANILVLAGIAATGFSLAYVLFLRRDLSK